jgi:hypothetical protein
MYIVAKSTPPGALGVVDSKFCCTHLYPIILIFVPVFAVKASVKMLGSCSSGANVPVAVPETTPAMKEITVFAFAVP